MNQTESLLTLESLLTTTDRQLYVERINTLKQEAFSLDQLTRKPTTNAIDQEILTYVTHNSQTPTASQLEKSLDELKRKITEVEEACIQIAFTPSRADLERIVEVLQQKFGEKVIIQVQIAPEIWGGMILEFRGTVYDQSLRASILKEQYGSI